MIVRHALATELDTLADVLTAAFADDPLQRWLFEPASDPLAGIRALFGVYVPGYFAIGHAYVADDLSGAALWEPPGRHSLPEDKVGDLLAALLPHLGDELIPRIGEMARIFDFRPAQAHLYLGILGVSPDRQGGGLGAELISPMLAECDRMGMLAHLESSNPRNIGFYRRHGFEVVDEYRCGGDGALVTILTRQPR